jgi:hypothetical protein
MLTVVLLASALASATTPAEPEIRAVGGLVTIRAQSSPLPQILDRLSSATGMEVRYEGTRPTNRVTVDVEGISEAEAIPRLMEGLGLSYVLRTDSSGRRVELLFVTGAGTRAASSAQSAGSAVRQPRPPAFEYEQSAESELIPVDPAMLESAAGRNEPIELNPQLEKPAPATPQAGPMNPTRPSGIGMRDTPQAPVFPQGVSFPRQ